MTRLRRLWVGAIPVVNAFADVTTNFFTGGALNTGSLRAGVLGGALLVLIPFRAQAPRFLWLLYVLLGYLLVRTLATSDVALVLTASYFKVALSMAMLAAGYYAVRDLATFHTLNRGLYAAGVVIVVQFLLAQWFGLGESVYVDDSFYTGGAKVQTTYLLALLAVIWPLASNAFRTRAGRWLAGMLAVSFVVVVFVVFRRGAILGLSAGIAAYGFLTSHRSRLVKRGILAAAIAVAVSPLYLGTFLERLDARWIDERPIQEEARLAEVYRVLTEFRTQGLDHALFGSELFNSPFYFGVVRQLHTDYSILLHGAGLFGLTLYFGLYFALSRRMVRATRGLRRLEGIGEIRAVFWALLLMSLVISVSGSLTSTGYRSALFLYLGALLGLAERVRSAVEAERSEAVAMAPAFAGANARTEGL